MFDLTLDGVTKSFGSVVAVRDVSLRLPGGKLVCFLGPSGCGKTTLLRLVAGLEVPSAGRIRLDDNDITETPAHQRNIGMVFQSLALFPHLTVGENVVYGLKVRGASRAARAARADELLGLVRLEGFADRHVSQLSGGQRQRVAMARALALEPGLFLLDEPLSALDAKLREAMQVELRQLQQRLKITTVVVTHDQREAMTMSDLIVVMSRAEVQQVGTPLEIYRNPANTFVADFIGASNLLPATGGDGGTVRVAERRFAVNGGGDAPAGGAVTLLVRPEDVHVLPGAQAGDNRLQGSVTFVRDVGASVETYLDCGGTTVVSITAPKDRAPVTVGDPATAEFPPDACVVLRQ